MFTPKKIFCNFFPFTLLKTIIGLGDDHSNTKLPLDCGKRKSPETHSIDNCGNGTVIDHCVVVEMCFNIDSNPK